MLDRMGESINPNREKELQSKLDAEFIKSCLAKDQEDLKKIQLEKLNARRKHQEMYRALDRQVEESAQKLRLERE